MPCKIDCERAEDDNNHFENGHLIRPKDITKFVS